MQVIVKSSELSRSQDCYRPLKQVHRQEWKASQCKDLPTGTEQHHRLNNSLITIHHYLLK